MASVKLTNELRGMIVNAAMKNAFVEEQNALDARHKALGDAVYRKVVSEDHEKMMKKLPTGFLDLADGVSIRLFRDGQEESEHRTDRHYIPFSSERRVPRSFSGYGYGIIVGVELKGEHTAILDAMRDLNKRRGALRKQVEGVVKSMTTVAKLLEAWPESKRFIPNHALDPQVKAPLVIKLDELNANLAAAGIELAIAA